jgi:hypothetical protein
MVLFIPWRGAAARRADMQQSDPLAGGEVGRRRASAAASFRYGVIDNDRRIAQH